VTAQLRDVPAVGGEGGERAVRRGARGGRKKTPYGSGTICAELTGSGERVGGQLRARREVADCYLDVAEGHREVEPSRGLSAVEISHARCSVQRVLAAPTGAAAAEVSA
jgi:hypothetical protein